MKLKQVLSTLLVAALIAVGLVAAPAAGTETAPLQPLAAACERPFADVGSGKFYTDAVAWMVNAGVTTGTSATTFSPDAPVTRGQLAAFMWRRAAEPAGGSEPFVDVVPGKFYSDAVAWMVNAGVTTGTSATTFSPDATVTRGQLAAFLWRSAGEPGCTVTGLGLASLGMDPLGRGDGFDINDSSYSGPCYEDDTLEANRPSLPDPRHVAAGELEAIAEASGIAADAARAARDAAEQAVADSFTTEATPPASTLSTSGIAYLAALAAAATLASDLYEIAIALLETARSWTDLTSEENAIIHEVVVIEAPSFLEGSDFLDLLVEVASEVAIEAMREFLTDLRDSSLAALEQATSQLVPGRMEPSADPAALQAWEDAKDAYDVAMAQLIVDGRASIDAWIFAQTAPSEYPPCDAEELRLVLYTSFCTGSFVNPISAEVEANIPGITARLDAYVARVCAAVG